MLASVDSAVRAIKRIGVKGGRYMSLSHCVLSGEPYLLYERNVFLILLSPGEHNLYPRLMPNQTLCCSLLARC